MRRAVIAACSAALAAALVVAVPGLAAPGHLLMMAGTVARPLPETNDHCGLRIAVGCETLMVGRFDPPAYRDAVSVAESVRNCEL